MMPAWFFTVRQRFAPAVSTGWDDYLTFSGFQQIEELVTLDALLCPEMITDLIESDWNHNVHEDSRIFLFRHAEYLISRQRWDARQHHILAIHEHPDGTESAPPGFLHCGYDIMESDFFISALTNCGPMSEAFDPSLVNQYGLIPDCAVACEVRDRMRNFAPTDPHLGACDVWSVARLLLDATPSQSP